MKNLAWMISLGLWGFLLAGCAVPAGATDAPMSPTALPSAVLAAADLTQQPMPAGECFWGAAVEVWEDTNGDGRQDTGEPMLRDIRVITEYGETRQVEREDQTGPDGVVTMGGVSGSCDLANYAVRVEPPAGYAHTTPGRVAFSRDGGGGVIRFGLKPGPATATITTAAPATTVAKTTTPTAAVTATSTALPAPTVAPAPSIEPSPTIPPTPAPTATPTFGSCDVLTRDQAGAILGPLTDKPFALAYVVPGAVRTGVCLYTGSLNQADVAMVWFGSGRSARAYYDQQPGQDAPGIGDSARWDEGQLAFSLIKNAVVIVIRMHVSGGARDQAAQIAQIAVTRVP